MMVRRWICFDCKAPAYVGPNMDVKCKHCGCDEVTQTDWEEY